MKASLYQPLVHRTAFATTCVALLPIVVGALVTTMGAGMAFRDWPSSDGYFMLTYPWLADLLRGAMKKFAEHGHRLAGMLIGCTSIALAVVAWRRERRLWVRLLATGVLCCVVVQGLLGGGRVLADDPRMAMLHGNFAAIVFCLMAVLTLVTSRRWIEADRRPFPKTASRPSVVLKGLAAATPLVIYGQFILGGRLRHLHDMLHEHVAGAVVTAIVVLTTAAVALLGRTRWLRGPAIGLLFLLLGQIALGLGAWVTRFGFPPLGYVAVQGTPAQLFVRSGHTVVGMLLLATSVVLALRLARLLRLQTSEATESASVPMRLGALSTEGGAR